MSSKSFTPKTVADCFYSACSDDPGKRKCNLCDKDYCTNKDGYTNLKNHIEKCHPNEFEDFKQRIGVTKRADFEFGFPKKTRKIAAWLEIVMMCLLPFSTVTNLYMRKHSAHDGISVNTLKKYMHLLTSHVEKRISHALPEKFGLVFDGWSSNDTHFVALFATYPSSRACGFDKVLLGFSPMGEEESLDSVSHVEYIEFVLSIFKKTLANVVAISGDNCAVNLKVAKLVNQKCGTCFFVGCASHRLNLAIQDLMKPYKDVINKLQKLMCQLKNLVPAAKLRRLTHLKAKTSCPTRWSSVIDMIDRYKKIHSCIIQIDDDKVLDLVPTSREMKKLDELYIILIDLNSATKCFQRENITFADVRAVLDEIIVIHPSLASRLETNAEIILFKSFESAIAKIEDGLEASLNDAEKDAANHLLKETQRSHDLFKNLPLAERVLKRRRFSKTAKSSYIDVRFIQATSNLCEKFFSTAGYTFSDRRRGLLPYNLECQLFLNVNKSFWDIRDVHSVIKNPQGDDDEDDVE